MRPTETETPAGGDGESPPALERKRGKGAPRGEPRGARVRRCRGGATRAGDLSQAEARSRPDEPEAEGAERATKGATGKGAVRACEALAERPPRKLRASDGRKRGDGAPTA